MPGDEVQVSARISPAERDAIRAHGGLVHLIRKFLTDNATEEEERKPEIAHFIDDLAESFMLKLNWEPSHILMNELRYIAVQMNGKDRGFQSPLPAGQDHHF